MTTTHSDSIANLAAALVKAQAAMKPAIKNAVNPHFKNNYADLPATWDACRAALTENGISVVQMPVSAEPGHIALTTMLLHASGEYIQSTASSRLSKDDPQGVGSAITYLRRYALAAMVGVVSDEDDDGNAASQPGATTSYATMPRDTQRSYTNGNGHAAGAGDATEKQLGKIRGMMREHNWDEAGVLKFASEIGITVKSIDAISKAHASILINELQKSVAE